MRLIRIIAIFVLLVLLFHLSGIDLSKLTPQGIRDYLLGFGIWAPVVYILLYTLLVIPVFPPTILTITSGLVFGTIWGLVYTLIGATLQATVAFLIARYLGREYALKLLQGKKLAHLDDKIKKHGFKALLLIRLLPAGGPPFMAVNFGAGLTQITFYEYILATFLGIIPGTFIYVYLGGSVTEGAQQILFAVFLMVALTVIFPKVYAKLKKKKSPQKK